MSVPEPICSWLSMVVMSLFMSWRFPREVIRAIMVDYFVDNYCLLLFFSVVSLQRKTVFFFRNMELVSQFCVLYNTVNSENWWRASDWIIYSILMLFFQTEQYFMYLKWVKTFLKFSSLMHRWPWPILAILFRPFGFIAPKTLNYLAFQSFDLEITWWRLFQKRVMRTKLDIYVFILFLLSKIKTTHNSSTKLQSLCNITRKQLSYIQIKVYVDLYYKTCRTHLRHFSKVANHVYGRKTEYQKWSQSRLVQMGHT